MNGGGGAAEGCVGGTRSQLSAGVQCMSVKELKS